MGRHAPVFAKLGIAVGDIPVLAQLEDSYTVFERTLSVKDLTWVEAAAPERGNTGARMFPRMR